LPTSNADMLFKFSENRRDKKPFFVNEIEGVQGEFSPKSTSDYSSAMIVFHLLTLNLLPTLQ